MYRNYGGANIPRVSCRRWLAFIIPLVLLGCGYSNEARPLIKRSDILWFADHRTGDLSQWVADSCGGPSNNRGASVGVSSRYAKSGDHSMALTISDVHGDQGARMFRFCESEGRDELYYGVWMYFPETFVPTGGWWNVFQYKSNTSSVSDPFFIVNVKNVNGVMSFYLYDWQERVTYNQSKLTIPVGEWVHLEARYKSSGGEDGSISVWQDGVLLFDVAGVRTRYADGNTLWSVNNYASSIRPDPATIYMDDATISRVRVGPDTDIATLASPPPREAE